MSTKKKNELLTTAEACVAMAKKSGAKDASARAYLARQVQLQWRDGQADRVSESTTRGVSLQLYVDGRYSTASTSDLRPDALKTFIADSVAIARTLAADPARALPSPDLYKGISKIDLQSEDPKYLEVTAAARRKAVAEMEEAARGVKNSEAILSVSSGFSDTLSETFLVNSNGFTGSSRSTAFFISTGVSVKDSDGRRPEDSAFAGTRFYAQLPSPAGVGREAAERAMSRLGSKKGDSGVMPMVIDNRAAGRLLGFMLAPLSGGSIQQKRSYLEGKTGQKIASELMTIVDDPLIPKAFGSRHFDSEGIAAKKFPVIEKGVLKNYYIDSYYGRKLEMAPTTGGPSNLSWGLGAKSQKALIADAKDGIFVTGFLGGNSNSLTGDFSVGIQGFRIREGVLAEPVAEMNVAGNLLEFWNALVAVGNDPYPYSSLRTPTLVFEGISFAGV
jgi:PmbA protein